jgi:streptogramin lyase
MHVVIDYDSSRADRAASRGVSASAIALVILLLVVGVIIASLVMVASTTQNISEAVVQIETTSVRVPTSSPILEISLQTTPTDPPPGETGGETQALFSFGDKGTGNGKFQDARAIALNGTGDVFVADYATGRVQRFTEGGEFVQAYKISVKNKTAIRCLRADRKGVLYVCGGGEILKIDIETGEPVGKIVDSSISFLDNFAFSPEGNLLALSAAAARDDLIIFSPAGRVTGRVDKLVSTITENSQSTLDIIADGVGNIFVLSSRENAIFKFTADGKFVDRFGEEGDGPGQLRSPSAIEVDSSGRIYVSDARQIVVFSADGRHLQSIEVDRLPGAIRDMAFNSKDELFFTAGDQVHVIAVEAYLK